MYPICNFDILGMEDRMITYIATFTHNYTIVLIFNLIFSIIIISLERRNPISALAWLFFMTMLPGIGFFFYLLLSQNISKRKIFKYTHEESAAYNFVLDKERSAFEKGLFKYKDPDMDVYRDIIIFHNKLSEASFTQNNDITIFTNGQEKFDRLIAEMKEAKSHIHLQYYIVKNDMLSSLIFDICRQKANEGVEIRLLIDHIGGRHLPKSTIKDLKEVGCEVYFFFPSIFKYFNLKANYRNHRKIAVIDGRIGYVGGFNIGMEYLGLRKRFGKWRDTHLRILGDAVNQLQIRFLLDWRSASKKQLIDIAQYIKYNEDQPGDAGVQIVSSGPDSINQQIKQGYIKMINSARKYIYIQTPYFVPDESVIEALKIAVVSGIDLRIMFPNKPDHPFVYWATYSFIGELLMYGARAYIYDDGFIHTKAIIVDDVISSVGTCNFDIRSFRLNFEVNAFIYDKPTSQTLRSIFNQDILVSRELTLEDYLQRPLTIKIKESISRLFSPVL